MIEPGAPAPDFTLNDQDGNAVTLSDLHGRWALVYFYPKADTPGCTAQACGIRERWADYEAAGAVVIGISRDDGERLYRFAHKHDLPILFLSDADHKVAEKYGVWVEKSMYGRRYWGIQRTTFVIAPNGKITKVFPNVSPKKHDDLVLAALSELTAA
jgi:peroxiredoxin Q/BCP